MYWPTRGPSVPLPDLGWSNIIYLADSKPLRDPTMVWGTTVELDRMDDFLAEQSRENGVMVSVVHVLIKAVSRSLREHPRLNRRVVGRKVYPYAGTSMVVPIRRPSDGVVDVVFFTDGEALTLGEISRRVWEEVRERALEAAREKKLAAQSTLRQRWIRLQILKWQMWIYKIMVGFCFDVTNRLRLPSWSPWCREMNGANAFVNSLSFPGAPPMISYKPSHLPSNAFGVSVTMGPPEQKPVVEAGTIVIRKVAPLFVRVDHRLANGHQAGEFIAALRNYLSNPTTLLADQPESAIGDKPVRRAA